MLKFITRPLTFVVALLLIFSCDVTDNETDSTIDEVPLEIQGQIQDMGFDVNGIRNYQDGYLVEGDIYLTDEDLAASLDDATVPEIEQYRTSNLVRVNGGRRTIRVWLQPALRQAAGGRYLTALRRARNRYNNVNGLRLRFQLTNNRNQANIRIVGFREQPRPDGSIVLGSAGFPRNGNPFNQIRMNRVFYDTQGTVNELTSTIAHEIGHCIGFRHTDFFNRSISCGNLPFNQRNEGQGGIGAIRIPGTPSGADLAGNGSYMLACSGGNRPFTANDVRALQFLY